jgi:hypothetical protein
MQWKGTAQLKYMSSYKALCCACFWTWPLLAQYIVDLGELNKLNEDVGCVRSS